MIRAAAVGLALLSAALLQTALFPHLALAGFRPDLLLLITAMLALEDGPLTGVRVGFGAGLVADLLLEQSPMGVSVLVLVAVGYGVGVLRPYLAPGSVSAPLVVAFASAVAGTAGYGILSRLLGDPRFTAGIIIETSIAVGFYNTLLAHPVAATVRRLGRWFPLEATARW